MTATSTLPPQPSSPFARPLVPKREAGGDNLVERDDNGRPRIKSRCPQSCICQPGQDCSWCKGDDTTCREGRVPGKREGTTKQCPKCKGTGWITRSYSRTTSYIDVLDDKSNLMAWDMRMVLIGADMQRSLLDGVEDTYRRMLEAERAGDDAAVKELKGELNAKSQSAKTIAGASEKAEKGTYLHGLSELIDTGEELPDEVTFGDIIDMDAYKRATRGFKIVLMEKLVVCDELKVAGTPDRVSQWIGESPLIPPDEIPIEPDELLITDLKTGSVEYGALKMAMQLALYSHSEEYVIETHERKPLPNINQRWGIIMHGAAGQGECDLYWADLTLGWEAVQVARSVRDLRNRGRRALTRLTLAA